MDNRSNLSILCGLLSPCISPVTQMRQLSLAGDDPDFSWHGVVATAAEHCVLTALYPAVAVHGKAAGLDVDLLDYLEAIHTLNADRNRMLSATMRALAERLGRAGIEFTFLKGGALLLHDLHATEGSRFLRDIDILIAPSALDEAAVLLGREGYRVEHHPGAHDAVQATDPSGRIVIELHRSVLPDRHDGFVPADGFLDRKIPVPGVPHAFTPCAEDMLAQNMVHSLLHDAHYRLAEIPLRDALDFALLAEHFASRIDWADLTARMEKGGHHFVMAFYANAIRLLFASRSIPHVRESFASHLTRMRWLARKGRPLDVTAAHTGMRNIAEIPWRLMAMPPDRGRILSAAIRPHRYLATVLDLFQLGRRQPGRFS